MQLEHCRLRRIHLLSGQKVNPGIVIVLALVQLGVGIFVAFTDYHNLPIDLSTYFLVTLLDAFGWELYGAICDLIITTYMLCFLSKPIKRSSKPTQVTLTRIRRLTLEFGILTAGVAMTYVFLSLVKDPGAFMIPGLALGKVYKNSILTLLNGRLKILGGRNDVDSDCVVNNLSLTERQVEVQQHGPMPSASA